MYASEYHAWVVSNTCSVHRTTLLMRGTSTDRGRSSVWYGACTANRENVEMLLSMTLVIIIVLAKPWKSRVTTVDEGSLHHLVHLIP